MSLFVVLYDGLVESSLIMKPDELREKIRTAAVKFTDEVIAAFGQAFASVASDFSGQPRAKPVAAPKKAAAPVRAKAAPPVAKKKAAPAKAKPMSDKRIRRSVNDLSQAGDEVINLLSAHKGGLRVEEINKALGTSTRELMRPIQKLLNEGKIKKQGERRATTYYVA